MVLPGIAPPPGLVPRDTRPVALRHGALFVAPTKAPTPPILCIHGAHHGAWCFDVWLGLLARAGVPAAALDLRGHATLAAEADPSSSIADFAADVAEAAAVLGRAPVLLGHSLGALVALAAAGQVPELAGLVLVAPSPPGNLPGAAPVPLVDEAALRALMDRPEMIRRFLGGETPPGTDAYRAALCPESSRAINDRYGLRVAVNPAPLRAVPGLVLEAGREDAARHPPGQDAALARFVGAGYRLLPDVPHCMMLAPWAEESLRPILEWYRAAFPRA